MAFDLHPILDAGQAPKPGLWYAVAPEQSGEALPKAKVGSCASFDSFGGGAESASGRVLISAGATPDEAFSELHQLTFSNESLKWEGLSSGAFPPRYEHATFVVGRDRCSTLYSFAGADQNGSLNDMWKFEKGQWSSVKTSGTVPSPRTYHTNSSMRKGDSCLVVYGGGNAGSAPMDDRNVYIFNPANNEWSSPKTTNSPPTPRQGHISAIVGEKLFIHGGMAGEDIYNDLHILDLETWKWSHPQDCSITPPRLAAHGCGVIGKVIYVFGGLSPTFGASDRLYSLDTETLEWDYVDISGPPPPARLDHAMCTILLPTSSSSPGTHQAEASGYSVDPAKVEGGERSDSTSSSSHVQTPRTVTIISPDSVEQQDFTLMASTLSATNDADPNAILQEDTKISTDASKDPCKNALTEIATASDSVAQRNVESLASTLHKTNLSPSDSLKAKDSTSEEKIEEESLTSVGTAECGVPEMIPVLYVFGGMDTSGNIHGDSFVFRPKPSLY